MSEQRVRLAGYSWGSLHGDAPNTREEPLTIKVEPLATGFQTALSRSPKFDIGTVPLSVSQPRRVAVQVSKQRIKCFGFMFPEGPAWEPPPTNRAQSPAREGDRQPSKKKPATRIKPPDDAIKLEDRLYYVLQPSLESLVASASLSFPFEPFPYQYQGIAFLYARHSAILADEMGLGKTMQAITAIRLLLCAGEVRRVLLVCPKPLVTNWQREFRMWAPEIPVAIIEGDQARRRWQWRLPSAPVKIANYELLMRDQDVIVGEDLQFDLVVIDEAQRIKNRNSTTSQVVRSLARSRSWALTGTPVENSSEDLVGIFEFLSPGYLSGDMSARRMGHAVRDHILRRTKDMVLTDLPPKLFRDAELSLSPEQHHTYEIAEKEGVLQLSDMGDEITIQHVFELVLRLKQICNFDPATGASSKLERLEADLEEVAASGKKAIVFSQWVKTIEQINEHLGRFGPLQYHGKIPSKQRDGVLRRFKEDASHSVLLMSYGAGSVGLNLQFCEYVFLFDRWWNPAVEDQAINRAHRIGAAGPVTVTRMLAMNTIEERINQVLEQKRELFETIFSQTGTPRGGGLKQEEIFGLFNLRIAKRPDATAA